MELAEREICYRALQTRDARFDGFVFVGVATTGIYCRPICPARTPRFEHCRFFSSAAAAQAAGFRPCLRCRPEAAPDLACWRGTSNTVSRALALIAEGALDGGDAGVAALAGRLGVGERQLRRLFLQHLGASPTAVAHTRRVLFAKQLIHETRLPMTEIALAAGFGSVRRFNEVFQDMFHSPPGALRRQGASGELPLKDSVTMRLRYRPPYDWEAMADYLRARAIPGVEAVDGDGYQRTVASEGEAGTVRVFPLPRERSLGVTIRFPNVRSLAAIVARVRRVFDTGADIGTIDEHLARDRALAPLVARRPGLRAPGGWDGFELAVRAVLGQQVSVGAARRLAGELVERYGEPLPATAGGNPGLSRLFPTAQRLAGAAVIELGMPRARRAALQALASAAAADRNLFRPFGTVEEAVARFRAIRGIGEWTAQYIALRALREPDAFPAPDAGLLRGAAQVAGMFAGRRPGVDDLVERAEPWRPWRAYAAQHLWAAQAGGGHHD